MIANHKYCNTLATILDLKTRSFMLSELTVFFRKLYKNKTKNECVILTLFFWICQDVPCNLIKF